MARKLKLFVSLYVEMLCRPFWAIRDMDDKFGGYYPPRKPRKRKVLFPETRD